LTSGVDITDFLELFGHLEIQEFDEMSIEMFGCVLGMDM
jgi:hypothetical protein